MEEGGLPSGELSLEAAFAESHVAQVLDKLDRELVGLAPVKVRVRDICSPPARDRPTASPPGEAAGVGAPACTCVHRQSGYGQNHRGTAHGRDFSSPRLPAQRAPGLGLTRRSGRPVLGHTAPKTNEVLKRAMGGVLFIDEAYYLYRPENERDYGQEAIEILLQVMESERDDLVVILAGYPDRMETFFRVEPRVSLARRAPHRVPGLHVRGAAAIADRCSSRRSTGSSLGGPAFREYLELRRQQPTSPTRARAKCPRSCAAATGQALFANVTGR